MNGLWAGSGLMSGASEALEAQRIARLAERPEGSVTRFDDISLRALATANLDRARDFVATEPGVLGAGDETTRRLAATVRTYLRTAYAALFPLMVGFNAVPKAAIVPILIVWFGIGITMKMEPDHGHSLCSDCPPPG